MKLVFLSWEFSTTLFHHSEGSVNILLPLMLSTPTSPLNQVIDMHVNLLVSHHIAQEKMKKPEINAFLF